MSEYAQDLFRAVVDLRAALARTGDALREPRVDALLDTELGLAAALAVLPGPGAHIGDQREAILLELAKARAELARCRRLGASLNEAVSISLASQGRSNGYGADGLRQDNDAPGALEVRG